MLADEMLKLPYFQRRFADLSEQQIEYVAHCVLSWRADRTYVPIAFVTRAIRKAKNNRP